MSPSFIAIIFNRLYIYIEYRVKRAHFVVAKFLTPPSELLAAVNEQYLLMIMVFG